MAGKDAPRLSPGWYVRTLVVVLAHPTLWRVALRQAALLARRDWWRSAPFLPLPDPAYLRFRLLTMYGSDAEPDPGDIVPYLRWCAAWPHVVR